ncbi:MAG: DUF5661 family protein, partial [bacterium]
MMIDYEQSIKEILNSNELTQEAIDFWCQVENIKTMEKPDFVRGFNDFSEDGLISLIMAIASSQNLTKSVEEPMNIIDFLDGYTLLAKEEITDDEIFVLYKSLGRLSHGTSVEASFLDSVPSKLDMVLAIDDVAHRFHSKEPSLLYEMFPGADTKMVKSCLNNLAGMEIENDVRKYNRGYYTTLLSDSGFDFLSKSIGKTTPDDISEYIKSYDVLFDAQNGDPKNDLISNAELLTLYRYSNDKKYLPMIKARKLDNEDNEPMIVGGYASVEVIDREGHLITIKALKKAYREFAKSFRTRNVMIAHCLAPETLIKTKSSGTSGNPEYTQIKNIHVGDYVYSSSGNKRVVNKVITHPYSYLINIFELDNGEIIRVTDEHPILTKRGWVTAGNITGNDILLKLDQSSQKNKSKINQRNIDIKGKTFEEIYGHIRAEELRTKLSDSWKPVGFCTPEKHNSHQRRNRTWVDVYGHKRPNHGGNSGENNPNWKGGISRLPYTYEFLLKKEVIIERDNHICRLCGKTEVQEITDINRKLSVHHIDYNKGNASDDNLVALCDVCNSKVNFSRDDWKRYFTELLLSRNCLPVSNGTRIISIKKEWYDGIVYNLEVDIDHTYSGKGIIYHNSDVQVGWMLPAFINKKGETFRSGVDDKGFYLITEVRPDSQVADRVRKGIQSGDFKSYSIAGTATEKQIVTKSSRTYMQVDGLELAEITICEKPVNQESHFKMLKGESSVDWDAWGFTEIKQDTHGAPVDIDTAKKIGEKLDVNWEDVDIEQFRMGLEVEQEHKESLDLDMDDVAQVALDHLKEDEKYYSKLKQVEDSKSLRKMSMDILKDGELRDKIIQFFSGNPAPSDNEVHAFAESEGLEPDDLEEEFYKLLGEELKEMQKGFLELENLDSPDFDDSDYEENKPPPKSKKKTMKIISEQMKALTQRAKGGSLDQIPEDRKRAALAGGKFIKYS